MKMENQHAKLLLDIEVQRNRHITNAQEMDKYVEKVRNREKELDAMQEKYDQESLVMMKKQRELDTMLKKYAALKEIFDVSYIHDYLLIRNNSVPRSLFKVIKFFNKIGA